jgi:hypothetical protein
MRPDVRRRKLDARAKAYTAMTITRPRDLPFPPASDGRAWPFRVLIVGGGVAGLETLRDVEEGYTKLLAVVIPPGPGWPLRGYELALIERRSFDSDLVEELVGLPAGRYLEQRLATEEPGLTMHLPTAGVPVLTYLQKDLAAGWRGRGEGS